MLIAVQKHSVNRILYYFTDPITGAMVVESHVGIDKAITMAEITQNMATTTAIGNAVMVTITVEEVVITTEVMVEIMTEMVETKIFASC